MRFQFFFKRMHPSEAVQDYADAKLSEAFGKYNLQVHDVHVSFAKEHNESEVSCYFLVNGQPLHLSEKGSTMYAALDGLIDRLNELLRRMKEKRLAQRSQKIEEENEMIGVDQDFAVPAVIH